MFQYPNDDGQLLQQVLYFFDESTFYLKGAAQTTGKNCRNYGLVEINFENKKSSVYKKSYGMSWHCSPFSLSTLTGERYHEFFLETN